MSTADKVAALVAAISVASAEVAAMTEEVPPTSASDLADWARVARDWEALAEAAYDAAGRLTLDATGEDAARLDAALDAAWVDVAMAEHAAARVVELAGGWVA